MGLFSLIASVFTCGILISNTIKDASFDSKSKEDAINKGNITWMDSHGNTYLISTGEKVYFINDKLVSVKDGKIIIDYSLNRTKLINEKRIKKANEKSSKYVLLTYYEFNNRVYYTEIATMKRYYLTGSKSISGDYSKFTKTYYAVGCEKAKLWNDDPDEISIEITEEEFKALGGTMTQSCYNTIGKY